MIASLDPKPHIEFFLQCPPFSQADKTKVHFRRQNTPSSGRGTFCPLAAAAHPSARSQTDSPFLEQTHSRLECSAGDSSMQSPDFFIRYSPGVFPTDVASPRFTSFLSLDVRSGLQYPGQCPVRFCHFNFRCSNLKSKNFERAVTICSNWVRPPRSSGAFSAHTYLFLLLFR